ncbi:hypothetical protein [Paraburkholderia elongata]|uniref:Uncharacterized protein n=1 Tax=Paraburkholderia elongata TaxID=2675747 RepID=A0A972NQJ8_9BURK|nr:hypothetical protein [Paraburkholderia elongata]NPT56057.1 hypothetical protein [Paraburkholderia elongata]
MAEVLASWRFIEVHLDTVHGGWYTRCLGRRGGRFWRNATRKIFGQDYALEVYDSRGILENYSTAINTPSEGLALKCGFFYRRCLAKVKAETLAARPPLMQQTLRFES